MKPIRLRHSIGIAWLLAFALASGSPPARAHCDTLDGPVVKAAQKALAERNVNLALAWVQPNDDAEIRRVFDQTLAVRKLGSEARELADRHFFETLVRLHRAGEGAPYTGLKPAGGDPGPAIPAGDEALATGNVEPLLKLLNAAVTHGLHARFEAARQKRKFAANDVAAGREFVKAYVSYIHFVEGVHEAASAGVHPHPAAPPADDSLHAPAHSKHAVSGER